MQIQSQAKSAICAVLCITMSQTARPTSFFARMVNNIVQRNTRPTSEEILVGIDYKGNKYYEQIGANVQERKLNGVVLAKRWYFPATEHEDDWDRHVPPEWEAWMRYRRIDAPTEEEINLNLAVAHMKQVNAAKIEEQLRLQAAEQGVLSPPVQPDSNTKTLQPVIKEDSYFKFNNETGENPKPGFPVYEEYETLASVPADHKKKRKERENPFID